MDDLGQYTIKATASPAGSIAQDIGSVGQFGSSNYNFGSGVYTIAGSGSSLTGTTDSFHFAGKRSSATVGSPPKY
jgi:hypothetical protein